MRPRTINARVMRRLCYEGHADHRRTLVVWIISHARKEKSHLQLYFFIILNELLPVIALRENGINKLSCKQVCALYTSRKRETYCFDIERTFQKIHRNPINRQKVSARANAKFIWNKIFSFERLPWIEQLNSYTRMHRIQRIELERMHRGAFANIIFAFAYKSG